MRVYWRTRSGWQVSEDTYLTVADALNVAAEIADCGFHVYIA